ncbi:MAG: VCBS repeat-containing protein [Gammaproteobacteria bacterium]|nr:VCBS repeat-containing protein [Gammaproteobacteria bacterium]
MSTIRQIKSILMTIVTLAVVAYVCAGAAVANADEGMTSPAADTVLTSGTQTFEWVGVPFNGGFNLRFGDGIDSAKYGIDLVDSHLDSFEKTGLPIDGSTVTVSLTYTAVDLAIGQVTYFNQVYQYTAFEAPLDTDGDGITNDIDTDDDNDGVEDNFDAFPLDPARSHLKAMEITSHVYGETLSPGKATFNINTNNLDGPMTLMGGTVMYSQDYQCSFEFFDNRYLNYFDNPYSFTIDNMPTDGSTYYICLDIVDFGTSPATPISSRYQFISYNEATTDTDGDSVFDIDDPDDDGDGVLDEIDLFPFDINESSDMDNDGIGDNADLDRDGDGFSNDDEEEVGTDPNDATSTPPDMDGDHIPDSLDNDRDGDGVENDSDPWPNDPTESKDSDGDGIGDNADDTPFIGSEALFIGSSANGNTDASIGKINGTFGVGEDGSANYSIPIAVPPGINGVQPSLSLEYNSNGGDAYLGAGWSLTGRSSISRCPHTEEDGLIIGGIDFDGNDQICLDGSPLVLADNIGSYGENGARYKKEGSLNTIVTQYADGNYSYFKVVNDSGTTMVYGGTGDSRVLQSDNPIFSKAFAMHLQSVKDIYDNTMTYHYNDVKSEGEDYLESITYGPDEQYEIEFGYEDRDDTTSGYVAPLVPVKVIQRLDRIYIRSPGGVVNTYYIDYEYVDDVSVITSIRKCSRGCLPAVGFETPASDSWQGADRYDWNASPLIYSSEGRHEATIDMNGDGLADRIWIPNGSGDIYVAKSNGVDFDEPEVWLERDSIMVGLINIPPHNYSRDGLHESYADVDGDGLPDRVWIPDGKNDLYVAYNLDGEGFSTPELMLDHTHNGGLLPWSSEGRHEVTLDMNGDGRADRVWLPEGKDDIYVAKSNGTGFEDPEPWGLGLTKAYSTEGRHETYADVNGDGLPDKVWRPDSISNNYDLYVALNVGGNSFATAKNWFNGTDEHKSYSSNGQHEATIDMNGDGLADRVWMPEDEHSIYVAISTGGDNGGFSGGGFNDPELWLDETGVNNYSTDGKHETYSDVNGDGFPDKVWRPEDSVGLYVAINLRGQSFDTPILWFGTESVNYAYSSGGDHESFADINGDGIADRVWIPSGLTKLRIAMLGTNSKQRITKITDSFGNETDITYELLTQTDAYTKDDTAQDYPVANIQPPTAAVTSFDTADGIGGTITTSYQYSGMKMQVRGLGPLGFRTIEITNDSNNIRKLTTYNQNWENFTNGLVEVVETYAPNDTRISLSINFYEDRFDPDFDGPITDDATDGSHHPYIRYSLTVKKALDGSNTSIVSSENRLDERGRSVHQYSCNWPIISMPQIIDWQSKLAATILAAGCADGSGGWVRKQHVENVFYDSHASEVKDLIESKTITSWVPHATRYQASFETRKTSYTYNSNGKIESEITEPDGVKLTKTFEYTDKGQLEKTTISGDGIETRFSESVYDDQGRVYKSYNALGEVTKTYYENDLFPWKQTRIKDVNGFSTETIYDLKGRPYKQVFANDNIAATFKKSCDSLCGPLDHYRIITASTGKPDVVTYYDSLSRVTRTYTTHFSDSDEGRTVFTENTYNAKGQLETKSLPAELEATEWTTFEYDDLGRLETTLDAKNRLSRITYNGLTTLYTGPTFKTKTVTKNMLGQTVNVEDNLSNSITYTYDPWGALAMVDAGNGEITEIGRNIRGFKTKLNDPDQGNWEYEYNALGKMVLQTDAKSQKTYTEYDVLGRLELRITDYEGAEPKTSNWTYGSIDSQQEATHFQAIGKLVQMTNNDSVTEDYKYEQPYGQLSEVSTNIDGAKYTKTSVYDVVGRPYRVTYDDNYVNSDQYLNGFTVQNNYHAGVGTLNRISGITGTTIDYWTAVDTNTNGQLTDYSLGNGINIERGYDLISGEILGISAGRTAMAAVQDLVYSWNDDGRLDHFWDITNNVDEGYGYDDLNRLDLVTTNSVLGTTTTDMDYYGNGNINTKSNVGTYGYANPDSRCGDYDHAGPHAVTSITSGPEAGYRCYDDNGNMVNDQVGRNITYSAFNKPTRMSKNGSNVDFYYGPDHKRYKREDSGTNGTKTTYYLGGGQFEKEVVNGQIKRTFYIGDHTLVTMETINSTTETTVNYLLKDHLGSTNVILDDIGVPVERMSFDPWGNRRLTDLTPNTDPLNFLSNFTNRGYTGHEQIDSVGLIHMNGRVYDPVLTRFVSPDPIIQAPKDLQSYNRYSYVMNNPLGYTDPSGYSWLDQAGKKLSKDAKMIGLAIVCPMCAATKVQVDATVRWATRNGYMKSVNKKLLTNSAYRNFFQAAMAVADMAGCATMCSTAFNSYMVGITGGDFTDMVTGYVKSQALGLVTAGLADKMGGGYTANMIASGSISYATGGKFIDGIKGFVVSSGLQAAHGYMTGEAPLQQESGGGSCPRTGAPIEISNGRKFLNITDIKTGRLVFTRHYNSFAKTNSSIDGVWRHGFERSLQFSSNEQSPGEYFEDSAPTVTAVRADGQITIFTLENNQWQSTKAITLVEHNNQWFISNEDNSVEVYNLDGQLQRIEFLGGYTQTLTYNADSQLETVDDSDQRSLAFTYNNSDQLFLVKTQSGETYQYGYNRSHHLKTVIFPDTTGETLADNPRIKYVYEDNIFPQALTGFFDESGTRFGTWRYDNKMRAHYEHTEGLDENTLVYHDTAEGEGSKTTVTDALGRSTIYLFNEDGKATNIEGQATASCIGSNSGYEYDDNGFISAKTDWNDNRTEFSHNERGLETSRTEAAGTAEAYTVQTQWHEHYRLPVRIIAPGKAVELTYNDNGLLISRTVIDTTQEVSLWDSFTGKANNKRTWTYEYNDQGLVATVDGPRANVADITRYEYDTQGNRISVENAKGHRVSILDQTEAGLPTHVRDANGVETHFVYNARGWLIEKTVVENTVDSSEDSQATTKFTYNQVAAYDGTGYIESVESANGSVLHYEYNAARYVTAITNSNGDRMEYELDNAGNPITETVLNAGGDIQRQQQRVFDELSRVINTISASGDTSIYHYDANGNQTEAIDAMGRATYSAFDALNRLVKVTDANLGETLTQYNDQGQVEQVTDARNIVTRYIRNGFGQVTQRISQDTGTTEYQYDNAGNRTYQKDARNVETLYSYDSLNRVTDITYPSAPKENIHYSYDDESVLAIGRLTTTSDQTGSTALAYNGRGNIVNASQTIHNSTYDMAYHYDNANQLEAIQYPSGLTIRYYRDDLGQVQAITQQANDQAPEQTIVDNISYLPFGPINGLQFGNGLMQQQAYDLDYRIQSIGLNSATTMLSDKTYGYNAVGQITNITDALAAANDKFYDYDNLNRLTDVLEGNALQPQRQEHFTYDAVGNRETYQRVANGQMVMAEQYHYADNANRLMSVNRASDNSQTVRSLGYDAVGNTVNDARFDATQYTLTYGANNRLASVKGATYGHNAKGQRVVRSVNGSEVHYIFDTQDRLVAEAKAGVITREYVYLGRAPLAVRDAANDEWYYSHNDHLGTPKLLTDQNQKVVWSGDALAFGETEETGEVKFAFRFPGQIDDSETGYYYNYFRDYDASLGRYLQSDPIGLAGGVNTFGYVLGNPAAMVDPNGLAPKIDFYRGVPPGSVAYSTAGGNNFYMPAYANFNTAYSAGLRTSQLSGMSKVLQVNTDLSHFGKFDYQRAVMSDVRFLFIGAFTDASNYVVGVYMNAAGYSKETTSDIAGGFATLFSSNNGDPAQKEFWDAGWDDANNGDLKGVSSCVP